MYMDKLDGRITQEFYDKEAATFRSEQGGWTAHRHPPSHAALRHLADLDFRSFGTALGPINKFSPYVLR